MIEAALQKIASELKTPDPISTMMVESQASQLLVHLARQKGNTPTFAKVGCRHSILNG